MSLTSSQLSAAGEPEHIADLRTSYEAKLKHPIKSKEVEWLSTRDEIVKRCPHLANASIDGWQGIWNFKAGWGAANDAVDSVGRELKRFGVKMVFGQYVRSGCVEWFMLHADLAGRERLTVRSLTR